jgi:hypothetical protein
MRFGNLYGLKFENVLTGGGGVLVTLRQPVIIKEDQDAKADDCG